MMKDSNYNALKSFFFLFPIILFLFYGCKESKPTKKEAIIFESVKTTDQTNEIAVSAPPFSEDIFPCSECHDYQDTDPQRRMLGFHEEIDEIFDHDSENRWCLDCHNDNTRDSLKLASGNLLNFNESYKLCGQCHGDKLRDWKVGVHGKRTGEWNGKKQYLLCVHCHNPHSPHFKKISPMPPPIRQEDLRSQK